jgi:acetyltransferase-like isoleucine patch superfamily enzyme
LRYYGKIVIEDNCFIGKNAIITAGVRIGRDSIIGPMAVVINDVKPGSVMIGNPAIRISTTDKYKENVYKSGKSKEWINSTTFLKERANMRCKES